MKQTHHDLSPKTLCWVGLCHVLVLLLFAFSGRLFLHEPREDFIPLIGLPDQSNPREGSPGIEGSTSSGKPDLTPGPEQVVPPAPKPVIEPQPAPPVPPQPVVEQKIPEPFQG